MIRILNSNTNGNHQGLIDLLKTIKMSGLKSISDDRSSESSKYKPIHIALLQLNKRDIVILIIMVLIIIAGLSSSLISFFLLRDLEIPAARSALEISSNISTVTCERALSSGLQNIMYPNALYNTSIDPLSIPHDQFIQMMYSNGGLFPQFIWSVSYCHYVNKGEIDAFTSLMRSKGGNMENFTITGRDALNRVISIDYSYDHLVILWTVPTLTDDKIRGYAITTDYGKNVTAIKARQTRKPAVSPVTILGNRDDLAVAVAMSTPVFNSSTGNVIGSLNGAIVIGELISSALNGIINNINVILVDNTSDAPNNGFMYSTETYPDGKHLSANDAMISLERSAFSVRTNMRFADRNYTLIFTPTTEYLSLYERSDKWIALILPLVFMLLLLGICVIIFFIMRLLQARKDLDVKRKKFNDLNERQRALQDMRDRSAKEVKKFRTIYDNIPVYIIILDSNGLVTDMNPVFERDTNYNTKYIERELSISVIIPEITKESLNSLIKPKFNTNIRTVSLDTIPVSVEIFPLNVAPLEVGDQSISISIDEIVSDAYLVFAERVSE